MIALRSGILMVLALIALLGPRAPLGAQGGHLEITMDELVDDSWHNLVVARGAVEIRFYGEILLADEVVYDRRTKSLTARGNVVLQEANGKVTEANALTLHNNLRDAFVAYARRQKVRIDR